MSEKPYWYLTRQEEVERRYRELQEDHPRDAGNILIAEKLDELMDLLHHLLGDDPREGYGGCEDIVSGRLGPDRVVWERTPEEMRDIVAQAQPVTVTVNEPIVTVTVNEPTEEVAEFWTKMKNEYKKDS